MVMGYPVIDIQTTLLGVQIKENQTDIMAIRAAANMAFRSAFQKASPTLLEPIMETEILVPEDFTGEVIGDLNARHGKIEQISTNGSIQIITASVPSQRCSGIPPRYGRFLKAGERTPCSSAITTRPDAHHFFTFICTFPSP